jgi:hypothetical protein
MCLNVVSSKGASDLPPAWAERVFLANSHRLGAM